MNINHFLERRGLLRDLAAMPRFLAQAPDLLLSSVSINILSLALPLVLMQVYDRILPNQSTGTLAWLVLGFAAALLLESVLRFCRSTITNWASVRFEHTLSADSLERVLQCRLDDYEKHGVGEYLDRFEAVGVLRRFYSGQVMQMLLDLPFAVVFLATAAYLGGYWLAVYAIGVLAVYFFLIAWTKKAYGRRRQEQKELNKRRFNFVIEALSGIHTLKALTLEEQMIRRHERLQGQAAGNNMRLSLSGNVPLSLGAMFSQIILFGIILISGQAVIAGEMTMGSLAACSLLGGRIFMPFQSAASFWVQHADIQVAKEQIREMAKLRLESDQDAPLLPADLKGDVRLEKVSFRYGPDGPWVIRDCSLDLPAGTMLGLDASGDRGTTTLLYLMMGLLRPESGRVLLDGLDLAHRNLSELRGRVAYVPQNAVMFNGSIFDNICMFNPRHRENARDAASLLGLDDAVAKLPTGYETIVGNRLHEPLPAGFVQRIALARALLFRPRVLLLDNVEESMDQQSEDMLFWLLNKLKGQMTIVQVTDCQRFLSMCHEVKRISQGCLQENNFSCAADWESGREARA